MKGNIFIKRPVMALSISVLILIVGFISLYTLPVEQYPDIAPPTVRVEATYTGANADAVMNSVIMPLEESINGVENMMYIKSEASNAGSGSITVYFKQGTNADMAAVNVQNKVAAAQGLLPSEVTAIGVSTMKRQNSFLQINSLISPDKRYDETFLANYLDINVIPQVKRIQGVGDVQLMGDTYSYVGAVVGATYPEMGKVLRKLMPKTFILVPGYGAQGGKGSDLVHFFNEDGLGAIVNSSRGIIAAYKQEAYAEFGELNYADASRKAVEVMIEDISGALKNR